METVIKHTNILTVNDSTVIILEHDKAKVIEQIIIQPNIQAVIIEIQEYKKESNTQKEIVLKENARLEYVKIQNNSIKHDAYYTFELKNNAVCTMHNFEYGLSEQINHYETILASKSATLLINGLVKLYENAQCNNHFNIVHKEEHTHSDIAYKHSMHDTTKGLFQAKTIVQNSALYSKAFQNSNTLLLSDDATIFTQPHLEIEIDELQASHGATTGTLNKDELLYLQSRGIEEFKAKGILLKAFENEILDKIENEEAKNYVKKYKYHDD